MEKIDIDPPPPPPELRLHTWTHPSILALGIAAFISGFGQFGVVAALGSVAKSLGHITQGSTLADQAGLSGTVLGIGLAIVRLASLGSLPITALADRFGRRIILLITMVVGLILTISAAGSPSFWYFIAIFALGRPFLTSTIALAQVAAAEQSISKDRAKAIALISGGYGLGAGTVAVIHSLSAKMLGFRGVFALAVIPLIFVPFLRNRIEESDRFSIAAVSLKRPLPIWGVLAPLFRKRLLIMIALAFVISFVTGPADSFIFIYAQNIVHQGGLITAAMVVGAGAVGLFGLLVGRWFADRIGRRPTTTFGVVGVAIFSTIAYIGSPPTLVVGYILSIFSASLLAPAIGAFFNELFPTSVRASATGWFVFSGVIGAVSGLVVFGEIANTTNHFSVAAMYTFLPVILFASLFWTLPETKAREMEDFLE